MSELKEYKLNELYVMSSGISSSKNQAGSGYPFVSFRDIFNNTFLPENLTELMNTSDTDRIKYSVKKGDVFITRTSETPDELAMSSVALKDYPNATFSGFAKRLRPIDNKKVYDKYMAFYFRSKYFRKIVNANTIMTLRASFNEEIFSYIKIQIPDYDTQVKIGDMLYKIEKKILINNQINNNLEELMKTIYQRWFIEFEFPNKEGKPYKSNGGKLVYNDILKKQIPEKWSVKKIGELTEVITGKEDANFSTQNGKYKFFTCSNEILQCDVSAFEGSSILIAGNGDFNVKHYTGRFNAYQRTYVLIPKDISLYCSMYISALYKINSFKRGSNGSIVKFITKNDVENIDVIIPNQKEYLKELNEIIFKIEKNNMENDKLKELKEFILPLLMNSQINVDDIEI